MQSIFDVGGEIIGRERDEELCTTGQRWKRDWSLHRKTAKVGCFESCQSWSHGYQASRTRNQEGPCIHRGKKTGEEAKGRSRMDASQDLEALGQESGSREARRSYSKGRRSQTY